MEEKVKRKSEIDLKHIKPADLKNNVRIYPPNTLKLPFLLKNMLPGNV